MRMAKLERVTVTMPAEMAAKLRAAVEAGEYATTSEVVREALRRWAEKQERREQELERLRAIIAEGEKGAFRDGEEYFDALEARLQNQIDEMPDAA